MRKSVLCTLLLSTLLVSCHQEKRKPMFPLDDTDSLANTDITRVAEQKRLPAKSQTALYMDSLGLANVHDADSTIIIRLMYATPDNFTGELLYEDPTEAYLHPDAAQALAIAHEYLKESHITDEAHENRILLRQVMKEGGFRPLPNEWCHFNLCSRSEAMQKYQLIK